MAVRRGKGLEMAARLLDENKKRGSLYNAKREHEDNITTNNIPKRMSSTHMLNAGKKLFTRSNEEPS